MAIALDGSAHVTGSATSINVTLTTTAAGVIVVDVTTNGGPITSVTASGLTFTQHGTAAGSDFERFVAPSSGAVSSKVITVNNTSNNFITVNAFGFSGVDTSTIYDADASNPNVGGTDPRTISTASADTVIVGGFRMASQPNPTAGTGFTIISGADYTLSEYKIVSSTQSGLSVPIGTGVGNSNGGIASAIIMAAGGGGAGQPTVKRFGGVPGMAINRGVW